MKHNNPTRRQQRGMTLIGLILVAGIVIAVLVTAMRVFPTVVEAGAVQRAIEAAKSAGSPTEARERFDKIAQVDRIENVKGKDLIINSVNDRLVIRYAYNVEIPLFEPAFLLMKYNGQTK